MGITPDCIAAVRTASGDKLTNQDAIDLLRRMEDLRKVEEARGNIDNLDARLRSLAAAEAEKAQIAAALRAKHAAMQVIAFDNARQHINALVAAGMPEDRALLAFLEGTTKNVQGGRHSVAATMLAYRARYLQDFNLAMVRNPEIARLVQNGDKTLAADTVREMQELRPDGQPGRTGNKAAQALAKLYAEMAEKTRLDLNQLGSPIGRLDGWSPQAHASDRVQRVTQAEWIDFVLPRLDRDRTFGTMDETLQRQMLADIYDTITKGVDRNGIGAETTGRVNAANLANSLAHSRVLHFADADAWLTYADRFGNGNIHDAMLAHFTAASKAAAQLERLGPNPLITLNRLRATLMREAKDAGRQISKNLDPTATQGAITSAMAEVQGLTAVPNNLTAAQISSAIRTVQALAKLGGAVISSLTDLPVRAAALTYQGKPIMAAWGENLRQLFQGRGAGEQREIAAVLDASLDGMKGAITAAGIAEDMPMGKLHRITETFYRWQGMSWWSDTMKAGAARGLAHEMGLHAAKAWDDLPARYRAVLTQQNITAAQWDAIRQTAWQAADGRAYVTPDRLEALPRQTLIDLARPDLEAMQAGLADRLAKRQAADAREAEWMTRRAQAFRDSTALMVARLQKRNAQGEAAAAERVAGMRDRMAELQLRLDELAEFQQAVAEGRAWQEAAPDPAAPRSSNTIRSTAGTEGGRVFDPRAERYLDEGAPETLAARAEGELRARLDALRRTIGAINREATQAEKGRLQDFGDWWNRRQVELDQFTTRMEARAEARAADTKAEADTYGDQVDRILARTRDALELRLRGFFADEMGFGFLEQDLKSRRFMLRGTQAGTVPGEFFRFIGQFKGFPVAFTQRVLGRALQGYSPDERLLQARNLGTLMAGLLVMGYVSMTAKDFLRGYSPRDPEKPKTWLAAFLQSGGAGIYGDFLFAQSNRFGNAFLETAAGPTAGSAASIINLATRARDGEAKAGDALNIMLQNTPFLSLWYVRPTLDFLILNSMRESLSPGFIQRQQQRRKEDFGQERIMPATAF
jgi:hypothetical protein